MTDDKLEVYKAKVNLLDQFIGFAVVNRNIGIIPNKSKFIFVNLRDSSILGQGELSDSKRTPEFPKNLGHGKFGYFVTTQAANGSKVLEYVLKLKGGL